MLAMALSADVVVGIAVGVHGWLGAAPESSRRTDPSGLLRQDRWSALGGAAAAGLVVSVLGPPTAVVTVIAADAAMGWPGRPTSLADVPHSVFRSLEIPTAAAMLVVVPGLVVGLLVLTTRAWSRLFATRLHLAGRRRLPLRLMRFLDDARQRGILRTSGDRYQFAHVRLQEHLALEPPATWQDRQTAAEHALRKRHRLALGGATAALLLLGASVAALPQATSDDVLPAVPGARDLRGLTTIAGLPELYALYDDGSVWVWPDGLSHKKQHRAHRLPGGCLGSQSLLLVSEERFVVSCPASDGPHIAAWQRPDVTAPWEPVPLPLLWPAGMSKVLAASAGGLVYTTDRFSTDGTVGVHALFGTPHWDSQPPARRRLTTATNAHLSEDLIKSTALSEDGHRMAAFQIIGLGDSPFAVPGTHGQVDIWDLVSGRLRPTATVTFADYPAGLEFSQADYLTSLELSDSGDVLSWCTASGTRSVSLPRQPRPDGSPAEIQAPQISNERGMFPTCVQDNGRAWVATRYGDDFLVREVTGTPGPWRTLSGHLANVPAWAFGRDPASGRIEVLAGADDGTIRIWTL
jgi:hypothetical protein